MNPLDTKIRAGRADHARVRPPAVPGTDLSGQVVRTGAAVSGFARRGRGVRPDGRRGRPAGIAGTVRGGRCAPAVPQTGQAVDAGGGSAAVGRDHGMAPGGPGRCTGRAEGSGPRPGRRRGQCRGPDRRRPRRAGVRDRVGGQGAARAAPTSGSDRLHPGARGQVRRRAPRRYRVRHRLRHRGRPGPGLLLRDGAHLHRSCGRRAGPGAPTRSRRCRSGQPPTRASSHCCRI
ncbi:hypothetical protein [Streptomyces viridochromogenes]|uniref:hypothetical protein n=1 Tax=Streptomyces viridochromogenes TaxID=1938 RepID=UPI00351F7F1F